MHIKIVKIAKALGKPRAFTVKVNGIKYPRERQGWYFTNSKEQAKLLALKDYLEINSINLEE